jgi:ABC-type transporter Mla subunit MlaD
MTARKPTTKLALVQPDLDQLEAAVAEVASQTAPVMSRSVSLLNRQIAEVATLTRERADFEDRRALLKRLAESADLALLAHVTDIDDTLALYPEQAKAV